MLKGLEKRRIPRMDTEVTFIGFGALEIGRNWGLGGADETRRPSDEEAGEVLRSVLDLGINLVDPAEAAKFAFTPIIIAVVVFIAGHQFGFTDVINDFSFFQHLYRKRQTGVPWGIISFIFQIELG